MIGLDTNILARFYVDDPNDLEAAKQRPVARRILVESPHLSGQSRYVAAGLGWPRSRRNR